MRVKRMDGTTGPSTTQQETPMTSILFTLVPVVLTFAVATWGSKSSKDTASTLQDCTNC
jgi:hypothetical protein